MGGRTLGVECYLLAVAPCLLMVHVAKPHITLNLIERLALVGQHAEKGRTPCTGPTKDKELLNVNEEFIMSA